MGKIERERERERETEIERESLLKAQVPGDSMCPSNQAQMQMTCSV